MRMAVCRDCGMCEAGKAGDLMPKAKRVSIEVVVSDGERFLVSRYADGQTMRKRIDPDEKPKRKPRKPFARAKAA